MSTFSNEFHGQVTTSSSGDHCVNSGGVGYQSQQSTGAVPAAVPQSQAAATQLPAADIRHLVDLVRANAELTANIHALRKDQMKKVSAVTELWAEMSEMRAKTKAVARKLGESEEKEAATAEALEVISLKFHATEAVFKATQNELKRLKKQSENDRKVIALYRDWQRDVIGRPPDKRRRTCESSPLPPRTGAHLVAAATANASEFHCPDTGNSKDTAIVIEDDSDSDNEVDASKSLPTKTEGKQTEVGSEVVSTLASFGSVTSHSSIGRAGVCFQGVGHQISIKMPQKSAMECYIEVIRENVELVRENEKLVAANSRLQTDIDSMQCELARVSQQTVVGKSRIDSSEAREKKMREEMERISENLRVFERMQSEIRTLAEQRTANKPLIQKLSLSAAKAYAQGDFQLAKARYQSDTGVLLSERPKQAQQLRKCCYDFRSNHQFSAPIAAERLTHGVLDTAAHSPFTVGSDVFLGSAAKGEDLAMCAPFAVGSIAVLKQTGESVRILEVGYCCKVLRTNGSTIVVAVTDLRRTDSRKRGLAEI